MEAVQESPFLRSFNEMAEEKINILLRPIVLTNKAKILKAFQDRIRDKVNLSEEKKKEYLEDLEQGRVNCIGVDARQRHGETGSIRIGFVAGGKRTGLFQGSVGLRIARDGSISTYIDHDW